MNYLFFFVHPSKFHVFRKTINYLISNNHKVDILITSKDFLEELVKKEGWEYKNIFPEGRKIKRIPSYISAVINSVRTIYRLLKFIKGKKYNLFITDDLLVIVGKIKKIPSLLFQDDDLSVVPEAALLLKFATHVLSPSITYLKKYESKKIGFDSYKELAYLHPNNFTPDFSVIRSFNPEGIKYIIIRLVYLKSVHDVKKNGISDEHLRTLIRLVKNSGYKVYISSERVIPSDLERYRILINVNKLAHALYYADFYIGDSQTMASEAAVLGTASLRFNDFVGKISVMEEKEFKYGLSYGYKTNQFEELCRKIQELMIDSNSKEIFKRRRVDMLKEKIDLNKFLYWFIEKYPESVDVMKNNTDYQYNFR